MPASASTLASRSTSATLTHHGSAAATRTPTGYCANTSPKAPTCPCTQRTTWQKSPPNSTNDPANDSAGTTPPTASTNYYCHHRQSPLLQPKPETTRDIYT